MPNQNVDLNAPAFYDVFLTTKEAAAFLGVSPSTLAYWRAEGCGPRYARLGTRTIRYRRSELSAYGNSYFPNGHPEK